VFAKAKLMSYKVIIDWLLPGAAHEPNQQVVLLDSVQFFRSLASFLVYLHVGCCTDVPVVMMTLVFKWPWASFSKRMM
jgi:hypothetical protein